MVTGSAGRYALIEALWIVRGEQLVCALAERSRGLLFGPARDHRDSNGKQSHQATHETSVRCTRLMLQQPGDSGQCPRNTTAHSSGAGCASRALSARRGRTGPQRGVHRACRGDAAGATPVSADDGIRGTNSLPAVHERQVGETGRSGIRNVNLVSSSLEATSIVPPCALAISLAM